MTGSCNRCGACCTIQQSGKRYDCLNLIQLGPVGKPEATKCSIHEFRYLGMPIVMQSEDGDAIPETCVPDFPGPNDRLPECCSYRKNCGS